MADAPRRVLMAWSGGKDSSLAVAALREDPTFEVVGLVTTITDGYDRISIHGVRRSILHAQSAALALPVFEALLSPQSSNDAYEAAWADAVARASSACGNVSAIAYGDLFLADVRAFREVLSSRMTLDPVFPLWGIDTQRLAERFIDDGFEAYLTCVDTTQLDAVYAGRRFDHALLSELPAQVDPCGEHGEFHTCVVNGPIFAAPIPVTLGERVLRDSRFAYCDLIMDEAVATLESAP